MTRLIAPMVASALVFSLLAGCGPNDELLEPSTTGGPLQTLDETDTAETIELTEDEIETIRQLPEADAELALVQKICPVTDEPLGSMGVPDKLDVKGHDVFICCIGCKRAVDADPDAILAKVPQGSPEQPDTENR